jgi:chemotaxis protein MotA
MDPIGLVGLLLVLIGVFLGAIMKHVNPAALFTVPAAFLIVIVASLGAAMMSNTTSDAKRFIKYLLLGIKGQKEPDGSGAIDQIVSFAERARREGLLALEGELDSIEDPFFRRGLQLAIDGGDPEMVAEVMESEVKAMSERHKVGAKFMMSVGIFSPTFGIIGAVFGLIATMSHLDDPSKLGAGIAAAFVATFWGVFLANGIFLPVANKLTAMSAKEVAYRRMIIEGVLAIQSGANPRMLDDLLRSTLPPSERAAGEDRKSA